MKNRISPDDCKLIFEDKLDTLTMKQLGIELKHFSIGTAPESPSFLVNQEELKKLLIEKFMNFFDANRSQGLEVIFLKSNYGNGKSHFIRTIYSFFDNFENIYAKKVLLKQEEADLKIRVLDGVGQKIIRESALHFVAQAEKESFANEKEAVLLTLQEKLNINYILSDLLYEAARNEDISKQSRAIAILKGNQMPLYLKTFGLKRAEINNEFYFNIIRLVCNYLYKIDYYLVIVFDEYEHVRLWKNAQARNLFFEDIKLFTDNLDSYKNLFFVFAESESVNNESEALDDPAYVSRKKVQTYQIENISSEIEVERLLGMIKVRYERYYGVSLDKYVKEILAAVNSDPQLKTNSNYRTYTQVIMKILDQYRNGSSKNRKATKEITIAEKWNSSNSIAKKTMLCNMLEHILERSDEKIIERSRKRGFYQTENLMNKNNYHIFFTEAPNSADLGFRYNEAQKNLGSSDIVKMIVLYPYKMDIAREMKYENVLFYIPDNMPDIIEKVNCDTNYVKDVFSYLQMLEMGC